MARGGLQEELVGVQASGRDVALVPFGGPSGEGDPTPVVGNVEAAHADVRITGEQPRVQGLQLQHPQVGQRRHHVPDIHREALFTADVVVLVARVRPGEVDATAVRRPLPVLDSRLPVRELLGLGRQDPVHRQTIELLLPLFAAPVHEPTAVPAERDIGDALLHLGDPLGLPAVGAHHVELVRVPVPGPTPVPGPVSVPFPVSFPVAIPVLVPVRLEHEEAAVPRPRRRPLVVLRGKRHLAARGDTFSHRDQVDVGLLVSLLPIRRRDGVEHPPAVRAGSPCAPPRHPLNVEEGHGL